MSLNSTVIDQQLLRTVAEGRALKSDDALATVSRALTAWFDTDFVLISGDTGEVVQAATNQPARDWSVCGQLCRAVARRGQAVIIEEQDPLAVLAIPLPQVNGEPLVGAAAFVLKELHSQEPSAGACAMLSMDLAAAKHWIACQSAWSAESLVRMGQMAAETLRARHKVASVEQENRDIAQQLSMTYEEISLLYRLTQNLKISSNYEELGTLALEWLSEVLPAEGLALAFTKPGGAPSDGPIGPIESMLTHGKCPLDVDTLAETLEYLEAAPNRRAVVVNQAATLAEEWPWPEVRELIAVPMCEGTNCFGWIVAYNNLNGDEFGSVEASLLSSVASILGIHCGNAELYHQQRQFFAGVVRALTSAIDAKDPYTCGHSDRVARVSVRLARELGCDEKELDTIYLSGLLHDVGKIGIDDVVLRKPGKLTEAEYEHIKTHTEIGYKILSDIKQLDEVLPVVLHHHEQWDGMGYPHGLAGENIPYLARIVAVADSFDAMQSDRPYRQGLPDVKLDAILRDGAGKQWDASVVDAFFRARADIRKIGNDKAQHVQFVASQW